MSKTISKRWVFCIGVLSLCALAQMSFGAELAKTYHFTGEITSVGKKTVTVRRGNEEAEFARPAKSPHLHVGQRITVVYAMDAKQVLVSPQAAGTVPDQNEPKQHIILDDRAFFNAKNQAVPDANSNASQNGAKEAENPS